MIVSIWKNHCCLSAGKKSTPSFLFSLRYWWRYCKFVILGTSGMPDYAHPKRYYKFVENFDVYLHANNKLCHSLLSWDITFLRILQLAWSKKEEPEFCQIWEWRCNINNSIVFHFILFPGKTYDKIFQINILKWRVQHFHCLTTCKKKSGNLANMDFCLRKN